MTATAARERTASATRAAGRDSTAARTSPHPIATLRF
jgi:hypothetical protein